MLKSIEIENFKKIKHLKLGDLAPINYLVGENGSGKSSVGEICWLISALDNTTVNDSIIQELLNKYLRLITGRILYPEIYLDGKQFKLENLAHFKENIIQYKSMARSVIDDFEVAILNNCKKSVYHTINDRLRLDLDLEKLNIYDTSNPNDEHEYFAGRVQKLGAQSTTDNLKYYIYSLLRDILSINRHNPTSGDGFFLDLDILSSGERTVTFLTLHILKFVEKSNCQKIIFIEEPENSLHPEFQKQIPKLLQEIRLTYENIQFIISTHSPFIISGAASLVEDQMQLEFEGFKKTSNYNEFKKGKNNENDIKNAWKKQYFKPNQKVYQIEDGATLNPAGLFGNDSISVSSKMLGAGLVDIHKPKRVIENEIWMIYCEGEADTDRLADSLVFNKLAKYWDKYVVFIGSGGYSDVLNQSIISKEFFDVQQGKINIIALLDGDQKLNDFASLYRGLNIKYLNYNDLDHFVLQGEYLNDKNKRKLALGFWNQNNKNNDYLNKLQKQLHDCIFGKNTQN